VQGIASELALCYQGAGLFMAHDLVDFCLVG